MRRHSATAEAKHQVQGALLANAVVQQGVAIFKLLAKPDQELLIDGRSDLGFSECLHGLDGVIGFDIQRDGLAPQGFDKDLETEVPTCVKLPRRVCNGFFQKLCDRSRNVSLHAAV